MKQIISTGLHSDGDSRLIHISAVTAGYANVLGCGKGLTFYVDGLTDAALIAIARTPGQQRRTIAAPSIRNWPTLFLTSKEA
jgi:hypothetical protein